MAFDPDHGLTDSKAADLNKPEEKMYKRNPRPGRWVTNRSKPSPEFDISAARARLKAASGSGEGEAVFCLDARGEDKPQAPPTAGPWSPATEARVDHTSFSPWAVA